MRISSFLAICQGLTNFNQFYLHTHSCKSFAVRELPIYIDIVFITTTLLGVLLFWWAAHGSKITLLVLSCLILLQTILGISGFYQVTRSSPPRFFLLLLPILIAIVGLFATEKGRKYINGMDLGRLTLLHCLRLPVELVLFWLFMYKTIPKIMTFEGRNLDLLAGLSAPFIYYFGFVKKKISAAFILIWNIVGLGLLLNIVFIAILSAPFPIQCFGFEQPDIALLFFPFVLLPGCVVPLVLFAHLIAIKQLLRTRSI
jgi:hypothetical protein